MKEIAIDVSDVKITYKLLKNFSIQKNLLRRDAEDAEEFEAVKGVSFQVEKGEILGIIGKNGSGKSTLLRAIAGVFCPNAGTVDLKGNTISLLSLGLGFKATLSGRKNIFISGMLLGFTEKQIKEKEQEIIEFAELGEFIDRPVKTYSSGMYSKLAFSITCNLETDIILVDEVLSVGDEGFQRKSLAKMESLIQDKDRTVIIVSHSIETLEKLCDRVMWMHEGEIMEIGEPGQVLKQYQEYMSK
ncbi:teichoic acids export ATP-binding protein TagH [Lachnospiraceae bacterium]|jgi:teichoic acid transport system ATP-binding protein|nr:ABC transporter ATP-binding protein [Lachnospiraceae bacterium]NBH24605.1 ABC transporter ATP-binding protein [Lachnospiraceae bacterium]GFI69467.1 teichoic acids export ATP-binding protein TagH [Lachnospiraceae bacterium]